MLRNLLKGWDVRRDGETPWAGSEGQRKKTHYSARAVGMRCARRLGESGNERNKNETMAFSKMRSRALFSESVEGSRLCASRLAPHPGTQRGPRRGCKPPALVVRPEDVDAGRRP